MSELTFPSVRFRSGCRGFLSFHYKPSRENCRFFFQEMVLFFFPPPSNLAIEVWRSFFPLCRRGYCKSNQATSHTSFLSPFPPSSFQWSVEPEEGKMRFFSLFFLSPPGQGGMKDKKTYVASFPPFPCRIDPENEMISLFPITNAANFLFFFFFFPGAWSFG